MEHQAAIQTRTDISALAVPEAITKLSMSMPLRRRKKAKAALASAEVPLEGSEYP
jgi:hypothetical protein